MVINIDEWLNNVINKLKENFSDRLLFVGLQGSYNRGEATPESDIDLVVILNELNFEDLKLYRSILDNITGKDKACGFISGKKEIEKWSKTDLFQFFYDTKPLVNDLTNITTPPSKTDIEQSIKINSEILYHAATHSFLHSNNYIDDLQNLYKMTFFILQAKYFVKKNTYISTKNELFQNITGIDKEILDICINKNEIQNMDSGKIETLYCKLIKWSSDNI